MLWLFSFVAISLLSQTKADYCNPTSLPREKCKVSFENLRPTQGAIGLVDVKVKRKDLGKEGEDLLKRERAPIVVGPNGNFYLIDKHHLTYAAYQEGWRHTFGEVTANFSDKTEEEFWKEMKARKWVRLKGPSGESLLPEELPKHIRNLKDDPYRSLAWLVRRSEAFEKRSIPFAEFEWADFFRTRIRIGPGKEGLEKAVDRAIALALSEEAGHLPGSNLVHPSKSYLVHKKCWEKFKALEGWY